jgi:hypothetical protein
VRAVNAKTRGALATVFVALTVALAPAARADTVVQVNVDAVLDGRSVSSAASGVVTPWSPGDGLDADDGFVTTAVEKILQSQGKTAGGKAGPALPDDGAFAADARHPATSFISRTPRPRRARRRTSSAARRGHKASRSRCHRRRTLSCSPC